MMQVVDQEFIEAHPLGSLEQHPDNPRRGNDAAVSESIEATGFYGGVIVQKSTGYVLAGNTRVRAAQDAGAESVPAFVVDCDDDTARRILLADNRLSDIAEYDNHMLLRLLDETNAADDLYGTGYDELALELLRSAVDLDTPDDPEPPEGGFPEIDPDDLDTEYRCPSCQYEWSGSPRPGEALADAPEG